VFGITILQPLITGKQTLAKPNKPRSHFEKWAAGLVQTEEPELDYVEYDSQSSSCSETYLSSSVWNDLELSSDSHGSSHSLSPRSQSRRSSFKSSPFVEDITLKSSGDLESSFPTVVHCSMCPLRNSVQCESSMKSTQLSPLGVSFSRAEKPTTAEVEQELNSALHSDQGDRIQNRGTSPGLGTCDQSAIRRMFKDEFRRSKLT